MRASGSGRSTGRSERPHGLRALCSALAASTAVHVGLLVLIALAVFGYQGTRPRATSSPPLRAALAPASETAQPTTSPAMEFVPPVPPAPASADDRALPAAHPAAQPPPARMSGRGHATINTVDASEPAEPHQLAIVRQLYPAAKRAPLEFESQPTGFYPAAAIERQTQLHARVLVVVHADGRIELPPGSFEDPVFAPAIRASLSTGKAHPLIVKGEPQLSWALLSFSFEFVGER